MSSEAKDVRLSDLLLADTFENVELRESSKIDSIAFILLEAIETFEKNYDFSLFFD